MTAGAVTMTGTETQKLRGYRCSHAKSDSLQRLGQLGYRVVWLYLQPHKGQMGDVGGRDGGGKRQLEGKANIINKYTYNSTVKSS